MAHVKVILRQDVPNLGQTGEVKQVAPGFFRNFLLPRGLAVEASAGQLRVLNSSSSNKAAQTARTKVQTNALAQQIEATKITIRVRVGEQGRIHGSVTNKDIAEGLEQQAGITVDRHKIEMGEPLKALGPHSVPVKIESGIQAHVQIELVPEAEEAGA